MIKIVIKGLLALVVLILVFVIGAFFVKPAAALLVGFNFASEVSRTKDPQSNSCSGLWSLPIDATIPYLFPLYPELTATYWAFKYPMSQQGQPVSIKLTGQFPDARYMSLHVYDADTGYAKDSIVDYQIKSAAGSFNPFTAAESGSSLANKDYEVWIHPQGSPTADAANRLQLPPEVINAALALRIYRPDDDLDVLGGTALPQISAFNADTGEPIVPCDYVNVLPSALTDKQRSVNRAAIFWLMNQDQSEREQVSAQQQSKGTISFLVRQPEHTDLLPNLQMAYAFAPLYRNLGEIALVTMKAPTFSNSNLTGKHNFESEVRYWSMCMGGIQETNTHACLNDEQFKVDEQGMIGVVIGPDSAAVKKAAQDQGYAYMSWGWYLSDRLLIVRHLKNVKHFAGGIQKVPDFSYVDSSSVYKAFYSENHIGAYAPLGRYCSEVDLLAGECNLERK